MILENKLDVMFTNCPKKTTGRRLFQRSLSDIIDYQSLSSLMVPQQLPFQVETQEHILNESPLNEQFEDQHNEKEAADEDIGEPSKDEVNRDETNN